MLISVILLGVPPVITPLMNSAIDLVNDTTNVSLTCEADGAKSYNWEREGGNIPSGATGVNTSTLTIINLTPQDAGNYRCVATNDSGRSESNYARLTINGEYFLSTCGCCQPQRYLLLCLLNLCPSVNATLYCKITGGKKVCNVILIAEIFSPFISDNHMSPLTDHTELTNFSTIICFWQRREKTLFTGT